MTTQLALLAGPPGVGRTTLARRFADEPGMPMLLAEPTSYHDRFVNEIGRRAQLLVPNCGEGVEGFTYQALRQAVA